MPPVGRRGRERKMRSLRRPGAERTDFDGWRGRAATFLAKADRSLRDARGQGAVHYAVRGGNGSALMEFLRSDADTRCPDADGVTPLELAADLGFIGLVPTLQAMVEHGARLRDEHLAAAVKLVDFPMVKYLVNLGMDVNAESVLRVSREASGAESNDGYSPGPDVETITWQRFMRLPLKSFDGIVTVRSFTGKTGFEAPEGPAGGRRRGGTRRRRPRWRTCRRALRRWRTRSPRPSGHTENRPRPRTARPASRW